MVKVKVIPLNKTIKVDKFTNLGKALQELDFELPCGGEGTCGKCRVKIIGSSFPVKSTDKEFISKQDLEEGCRLACQHQVEQNITVEVEQWELDIEEKIREQSAAQYSGKYGIAIDAGSTTIAGHLVDLSTGNILMTKVAYNSQKKYGADIMTRMDFARKDSGEKLQKELRESIHKIVKSLAKQTKSAISKINIVGNTFIHHSFCGLDLQPLMTIPYQATSLDKYTFQISELDWSIHGEPQVTFLPNLGGYVGSDILAGILSTEIDKRQDISLLIDIGTNGEIVLGNQEQIYFASTAAGPAFEGGKIKMGMRADRGAITHAHCKDKEIIAEVKDNGTPRGICGSGLLDAVACGLRLGKIDQSGRLLKDSDHFLIKDPVKIYQKDIRELQLAKGALAAGVEALLHIADLSLDQIDNLYLAGAFGNYLNIDSAIILGLLRLEKNKIYSQGNTALRGAVLSLFQENFSSITSISKHIELNSVSEFQDIFIQNMGFPKNYNSLI